MTSGDGASSRVGSSYLECKEAFAAAFKMLEPDDMLEARQFVLHASAADDLAVLSDQGSLANANFLSGERHYVGAPADSGLHLSAIRVPARNVGPRFEYTIGFLATRVAAAPRRRQLPPPSGMAAQPSIAAPATNMRVRAFSSGRFICNIRTGETLTVLADLRLSGDSVETVSVLWRGPPHSGDSRVCARVEMICDAKMFADGHHVASVLFCERTVHVSWRRASFLAPPADARDLCVACRNMTFFDSGMSVAFELPRRADEPARLDIAAAVSKSDDSFLARAGTVEELASLATIADILRSGGPGEAEDNCILSADGGLHIALLERACAAVPSLRPGVGVSHERALLRRASLGLEVEVAAAGASKALVAASKDDGESGMGVLGSPDKVCEPCSEPSNAADGEGADKPK
jgi:hypothetical protein